MGFFISALLLYLQIIFHLHFIFQLSQQLLSTQSETNIHQCSFPMQLQTEYHVGDLSKNAGHKHSCMTLVETIPVVMALHLWAGCEIRMTNYMAILASSISCFWQNLNYSLYLEHIVSFSKNTSLNLVPTIDIRIEICKSPAQFDVHFPF